jgi:hypothetical protein
VVFFFAVYSSPFFHGKGLFAVQQRTTKVQHTTTMIFPVVVVDWLLMPRDTQASARCAMSGGLVDKQGGPDKYLNVHVIYERRCNSRSSIFPSRATNSVWSICFHQQFIISFYYILYYGVCDFIMSCMIQNEVSYLFPNVYVEVIWCNDELYWSCTMHIYRYRGVTGSSLHVNTKGERRYGCNIQNPNLYIYVFVQHFKTLILYFYGLFSHVM